MIKAQPQIPKELLYETMCKKDYSIFCKDEYYYCIIVDSDSYCVLYKLNDKTEISKVSHIWMNGVVYDNLAFLNKEFIKYFYTKNEMRKLKIKKLNETF